MGYRARITIPEIKVEAEVDVVLGDPDPAPDPTPDPSPDPAPDPTPDPSPDPTPDPTPDPSPDPSPTPDPPDPTPDPPVDPNPIPSPTPTPDPRPRILLTPDNVHSVLSQPNQGVIIEVTPGIYSGVDPSGGTNYAFFSNLEDATLVQYPGVDATFSGPMQISGHRTDYIGINVHDLDSNHYDSRGGSWALRESDSGWGFNVTGDDNRLINCNAAECSGGILATNNHGLSTYGCILLNNGWIAPDRTHGHGCYNQNQRPHTLRHEQLTAIRSFGRGLQWYAVEGSLEDMFGLDCVFYRDNFFLSGAADSDGNTFLGAWSWTKPKSRPSSGHYGQSDWDTTANTKNANIRIQDGFFHGGLALGFASNPVQFSGNTLVGGTHQTHHPLKVYQNSHSLQVENQAHEFTGNRYYGATNGNAVQVMTYPNPSGPQYTWAQWQNFGHDAAGLATATLPVANYTKLMENQYERGRYLACVANYERRSEQTFALQAAPGEIFDVVNVDDLYAAPIQLAADATGRITIPLDGWGSKPCNDYGNLIGRVGLEYFEANDIDPTPTSEAGVFLIRKSNRSRDDLLMQGV